MKASSSNFETASKQHCDTAFTVMPAITPEQYPLTHWYYRTRMGMEYERLASLDENDFLLEIAEIAQINSNG